MPSNSDVMGSYLGLVSIMMSFTVVQQKTFQPGKSCNRCFSFSYSVCFNLHALSTTIGNQNNVLVFAKYTSYFIYVYIIHGYLMGTSGEKGFIANTKMSQFGTFSF